MVLGPTYFRSRLDTNGTRLKGLNAEPVTYRRGATSIPNLMFTFILSDEAEEIIPAVAVTRIERQDIVGDTEDLKSNGLGLPQPGDEIIRSNGEVYRLISMAGDNPPYTFVTSSRLRIRLHAEQIA